MSKASRRAIVAKQIELRKKLWPLIEDTDLWIRTERNGFATIPRAMPILAILMDGMNKGAPVSATYLSLWCMVMDELFLTIQSPTTMAFHAGFEGERAVRTWRDRMKRLKSDGFIDFLPGQAGDITFVLLLNPYHVIRRHAAAKHPALTELRMNTLIARVHEIQGTDMDEKLPNNPLTRKPPKLFDLDDEIPF